MTRLSIFVFLALFSSIFVARAEREDSEPMADIAGDQFGAGEARLIEAWDRSLRALTLCKEDPKCLGARKEYEKRIAEVAALRPKTTLVFEERCVVGDRVFVVDIVRRVLTVCQNHLYLPNGEVRFDVRENFALVVEGLEAIAGPGPHVPFGKPLVGQIRKLDAKKITENKSPYAAFPTISIVTRDAIGEKTFDLSLVDRGVQHSIDKAILEAKPCEKKNDKTVRAWAASSEWDTKFLTIPMVRGQVRVVCEKGVIYVGKYRCLPTFSQGRISKLDIAFEGLKAAKPPR